MTTLCNSMLHLIDFRAQQAGVQQQAMLQQMNALMQAQEQASMQNGLAQYQNAYNGYSELGTVASPPTPTAFAVTVPSAPDRFATSQAVKLAAECDRLIERMAFWRGFLGRFAAPITDRLADNLNAKTDKIEHWIGAAA